MSTEIDLKIVFPASIDRVFSAWLNSREHTAMTGVEAQVSDQVGESFQAWEGYISGENLRIVSNSLIEQSWRTADFKTDEPDSHLELHFTSIGDETEMHLIHQHLPEGTTRQYLQGWQEFYFKPMLAYFSK